MVILTQKKSFDFGKVSEFSHEFFNLIFHPYSRRTELFAESKSCLCEKKHDSAEYRTTSAMIPVEKNVQVIAGLAAGPYVLVLTSTSTTSTLTTSTLATSTLTTVKMSTKVTKNADIFYTQLN
jgi:hypothetical protein